MSPSGLLKGPAVVTNDRTEISPEMLEIARSLGTYALTDTLDFTELDVYVDGLPDNPLDAAEELCRAWAYLINESMVDDYSKADFESWMQGKLLRQSMSLPMVAPVLRSLEELVRADAGTFPWRQVQEGLVERAFWYLHEHRWATRSGLWKVSEALLRSEAGPKRSEAHRRAFCGVLLMAWASVNSGSDALAVIRDYS